MLKITKLVKNKDRAREKPLVGSTKTDIHVSLDNKVYDRLFKFRNEAIGYPSYSGILNTAIDSFMDLRGY